MLRDLHSLTVSMNAHRNKMDIITNNIANVDTTGYKKDRMTSASFQDIFTKVGNPYNAKSTTVGGAQSFPVYQANTDLSQGDMQTTDRLADLMLQGSGYFTVSTPAGERYTRNGSFSVSSDGYLTDTNGNPVLGTMGNIQVGSGDFAVDEQGNVSVNGQIVNKLRIVDFADPAGLSKVGDNLYTGNGPTAAPADTKVLQGCLEMSNVDVATEMVGMLEASRAYSTSLQMINMMDGTLNKAVNEVGRV